MAGRSASLLTKTQRSRIHNEFADLDEAKRHRDRQRIRERVRAGLLDFQHLSDYPDRQLALMFDDVPHDELRTALADATIVVERLREQSGIDRAELVGTTRARAEQGADETADTETLERIDPRTPAEIRRRTEDDLAEQFEPGRWDERANGLSKLGVGALVVTISGNLLYSTVADGLLRSILHSLLSGAVFLLFASAIGWTLINAAQVAKHDLSPFVAALVDDPEATVRKAVRESLRNPLAAARESWDEL